MGKILVMGSSNMDLVLGVDGIPRPGETIMSTSYSQIPGGKGANQACACAKLGGDCKFLSAVGQDGFGEMLLSSLDSAGVDIHSVVKYEDLPTGMAVITVDKRGENSIVVIPGANQACDNDYLQANENSLLEAETVLSQLEVPVDCVVKFMMAAKALGKRTILNPAPAPEKGELPDELFDGLDYFTPNETELEKITGRMTYTMEQIIGAAKTLLDKGTRNVIVTVGSKGAVLVNQNGARLYETVTVDAVDTTAAGDTFNAGLAVALTEGKSIEDAIIYANAAASISVTRKGAQVSIPTCDEVETLLKKTAEKQLVH